MGHVKMVYSPWNFFLYSIDNLENIIPWHNKRTAEYETVEEVSWSNRIKGINETNNGCTEMNEPINDERANEREPMKEG